MVWRPWNVPQYGPALHANWEGLPWIFSKPPVPARNAVERAVAVQAAIEFARAAVAVGARHRRPTNTSGAAGAADGGPRRPAVAAAAAAGGPANPADGGPRRPAVAAAAAAGGPANPAHGGESLSGETLFA
jgi:hypothetical protein